MTINIADNSPRISYSVASGVTQTSFAVPFEFFDDEDLNVYVDGTLKTLTSDYTVTGGDGSTGTVTISVTGASGGSTVVITRDIPLERTTDFPVSGAFNIVALNTELDRLIAVAADLDDLASRAITPLDYDPTVSYTLPTVDNRKGKTLAFNEVTGSVQAGPSIADTQSVADASADIALLADIQDGTVATNAITTAANVSSQIATLGAISSDITTVSGISSNVTTVASNDANVTTVAGISSNVTTVADNIADINTVADDLNEAVSEINTVATDITNVNTVGTNITNVNTTAGSINNVNTVASDITNVNTVSTNISNVNTVAGISANVTTVAGQTTNLQNVTDNLTAIQNAASNATSASDSATAAAASAAAAALSADTFDDTYLGSKASDPSLDNDGDALNAGDLYFNTTSNTLKVYSGSAWQDAAVDSSGFVQTTGDSMTGNLSFGDNDKAVFGAGSDLQIYHDGLQSYVLDNGTGNLNLRGTSLRLSDASGTHYLVANSGAEVSLTYSGAIKLATTSTGIDVTGTVTADGLTVQDASSGRVLTGVFQNTTNALGTSSGISLRNSAESTSVNLTAERVGSNAGADLVITGYDNAAVEKNFLRITEGNDISFYEDTGTTAKFFWDASAESLGIGTTSPSTSLTVVGNADAQTGASISHSRSGVGFTVNLNNTNNGANKGSGIRWESGGFHTGSIIVRSDAVAASGDAPAYMTFHTSSDNSEDNAERMRIDSSGNVGIGTSSPSERLDIQTTAGRFKVKALGGSSVQLESDSAVKLKAAANDVILDGASNIIFDIADVEKMRIDSSGNLLVGKTSANTYNTTAGFETRPDGLTSSTRDGAISLILNRLTSDGDIAVFRKDGTTVGSIGSYAGAELVIGTDETGLLFGDGGNNILPYDVGATPTRRDDAISFGNANYRFKDLYLSGGVYLGGTGAANKLDDYEEGTWTPVVLYGGSQTGQSYSIQQGRYTKIGRNVSYYGYVQVATNSTATGNLTVGGLPFTSQSGTGNIAVQTVALDNASSNFDQPVGRIDNNSSEVFIMSGTGTNNWPLLTETVRGSAFRVFVAGNYITDA